MKQVRRVLGAQMRLGAVDDCFGLVADDLAHDHRPQGERRAQTLIPGVRIPLRLVAFQEDEIRHRLDPHQADFGVKRLVCGDADFPRQHVRRQPLIFLLAKGDQQRLHLARNGLLGAVGRGDEFVQAAQFQELTQTANSAVVGLHEDQMGSDQ
jgi:hypothetical protein